VSALPGAATGPGTRRGADSFGAGARALGRTGLTVSPIAFGAGRVRDEAPLHRRALADALRGGVNLIDTCGKDGAQRVVGRMLANLVQHGELRREQVVVVSRLGRPAPEQSSLDPSFVRAEVERSRQALGVQTLDVALLHEPEPAVEQADDAFRGAFEVLEALVREGSLGWYGVSSRAFADRTLSVEHLLRLATDVGGASHRFGVVRTPLNLFELGAVLPEEGAQTCLAQAAAADVGVIAHRPLEAFVDRGPSVLRLADMPVTHGSMSDAAELLARVRKLEAEWASGLGQQLMVGPGDNAVDLFRWGQELAPRLSALSLEQWVHLRHDVVAVHLGRTSAALLDALEGDTRRAFAAWWERYGTCLHDAFDAIEATLRVRRHDLAQRIGRALDPLLPAPWRPLPLSNKAILTSLSAPVSAVAVGMRQPGYVHDVLALRDHPVRLMGASAGPVDWGALASAMAEVELSAPAVD